ncbi:MAG: hypothetical protein NVSMB48_08400 [Marmoricola sp.]
MSGRITPTLPLAWPVFVIEGAWALLFGGLLNLHAAVIEGLPDEPPEGLPDPLLLLELPQAASEAAPRTSATPDTDARRNTADTFPPEEW